MELHVTCETGYDAGSRVLVTERLEAGECVIKRAWFHIGVDNDGGVVTRTSYTVYSPLTQETFHELPEDTLISSVHKRIMLTAAIGEYRRLSQESSPGPFETQRLSMLPGVIAALTNGANVPVLAA